MTTPRHLSNLPSKNTGSGHTGPALVRPALTQWRVLAPAGGFPSPAAICNAWSLLNQFSGSNALQNALKQRLGHAGVNLTGSGKLALRDVLNHLKSQKKAELVAMSAYTCPDIAAAVLDAGLRPLVVDIHPRTLEPLFSEHSELVKDHCVAVLLSNLYGLPDDIEAAIQCGSPVIDDACQAALSARGKTVVGGDSRTHAIFSFGRGKAFSAVGGGAYVTRDNLETNNIEVVAGGLRSVADLLRAFSFWLMIKPALYAVPARIAMLRLGETKVELKLTNPQMSLGAQATALAAVGLASQTAAVFVEHAHWWHEALQEFDLIEPFIERQFSFDGSVVPIRYPVLFSSASDRDACFQALAGRGLGVSISYPSVLMDYPVLRGKVQGTAESARSVASRILTFPVHQYLQKHDVEQAVTLIRRAMRKL